MITFFHREFDVDVPLELAWQHLAKVGQWPTWARHLKRIYVEPPGELKLKSVLRFELKNGVKMSYKVIELDPPRHWKRSGQFLWFTIYYDHKFESVASDRTKLVWTYSFDGFMESSVGRLFAAFHKWDLDKALPNLIAEMNALNR